MISKKFNMMNDFYKNNKIAILAWALPLLILYIKNPHLIDFDTLFLMQDILFTLFFIFIPFIFIISASLLLNYLKKRKSRFYKFTFTISIFSYIFWIFILFVVNMIGNIKDM